MIKRKPRVRYAVVGQGHFAQNAVLPAFANARKNSELVALVSDNPEKRNRLGRKYGVPHTLGYDEFDDFLGRDEVDAVYIVLPNHKHREYAERAARAKKHVLCEKPMAVSSEDCEAMIRACDDAGVKLMVAYRLHFEPCNLRAIELVRSGRIGDPRYFSSMFSYQVKEENIRTNPRRMGGGPLYDIGVYCINAARYIFQAEPVEVMAFAADSADRRFKATEETLSATLRFPDERLATFTVSYNAEAVDAYEVVGTEGRIRVQPAFEYEMGLAYELTAKGKTRAKQFPHVDQIAPELVYFSDCIREDRSPEPSGVEGLADVRIIEALHRSADTRAPVTLGGFEKAERPTEAQEQKHRPRKPAALVEVEEPVR